MVEFAQWYLDAQEDTKPDRAEEICIDCGDNCPVEGSTMTRNEHTHDLTHSMYFGDWHRDRYSQYISPRMVSEVKATTTELGFKMRLTRFLNEIRKCSGNEPYVHEESHRRPNQNDRLVCVVWTTKDRVTYSDLFVFSAKDGVS